MCPIFGPKMAHLSWTKIFWYKLLLLLSSTYWPFSLCKIQNYGDLPFLGTRMVHLPQTIFFLENYYYHSHLPITPFHCAKLKKILPADSELWEYAIFGPISPTEHFFFFRKAGNEPCFFYSCLSTCQKSKSDINLLVEY